MNGITEVMPKGPLNETLSVRGPELTGLLADLRGQGAILLAVSVTGQNHYSVTYRPNNFRQRRRAKTKGMNRE